MTDFGQLHADQIAQAHRRLDAHEARHSKSEERLTGLEVSRATEAERSRNIEVSLADIKASITWVIRLVIGGLIAGAVTFALSGGFHVGT